MTEPKKPPLNPAKDETAPETTWPGQVPGSGESPLDDKDRVPLVPNDIQVAVTPPDGAPQPKPQDEDPGINANVVS